MSATALPLVTPPDMAVDLYLYCISVYVFALYWCNCICVFVLHRWIYIGTFEFTLHWCIYSCIVVVFLYSFGVLVFVLVYLCFDIV